MKQFSAQKQFFWVFPLFGVLALALVTGCTQPVTAPPAGTNVLPLQATVSITENGYEPQIVSILKGGTVTWTNVSDRPDWPASAMHPTHEKYPGSSITKCGTLEENTIFDACRELGKGESYSFTFNEVGEWAYHDHVAAATFGKIVVVES